VDLTDYPNIERVPPNSIEAERAVLGAVLLNNEVFVHISLRADQFYRTGHQEIYTAMCDMDTKGVPVDIITLVDALKSNNTLDRAGGAAYISTLTNEVPSVGNAVRYAQEIVRLAALRKIIHASNEIASDAYAHGADLDELSNRFLDMFESNAPELVGAGPREVMGVTFENIRAAYAGELPPPITTGLIDLDNAVSIIGGDFVVLAGRPGMGKTSIAMAIARHVAKTEPVGIWTLEMDVEDIGQVFIAQETKISRKHIRQRKPITDEGFAAMEATCRRHVASLRYRVFDKAANPSSIRKAAKLMKKREGLGLIIIDYISLMEAGIRTNSREEAVAYISRSCKRLAKELHVPVLGLQQLNRQCESRPDKKPNLADLRESGAIEQDADVVMLAYRPEKYWPADEEGIGNDERMRRLEWAGVVQLLIEKQRAGDNGIVKLGWDGPATNVFCMAREGHNDYPHRRDIHDQEEPF
jgi:replicative DNA helicase